MVLEVLICTYNEGILRVPDMILAPRPDIKWLVAFQYSDSAYKSMLPPIEQDRTDITIVSHAGRGLSRNRNMAVSYATGDILLLADDDAKFDFIYFDRILEKFKATPSLDIACFQAVTHNGYPLHSYPSFSFSYENMPKGYWVNSQEIAFRNTLTIPAFDERFGINAPKMGCGEEEVFLWQAYRKGLNITYFPEVIVETDARTSRHNFFHDISLQRAKGGVLCIMHGVFGAFLRCLKFAMLNIGRHNPFSLMWHMTYGIFYVKR